MEKKRTLFWSDITLFVISTFVAILLPLLWQGAVRLGALIGVATATAASILSIFLSRLTVDKGLNRVLAALIGGLLCRMLMVALGMWTAVIRHANPIAFCVGFFVLFFAHQIIEISMVIRHANPISAQGKT